MKYFPVSNEAEARAISAIIYRLTRPAGADATETTKYALGWQIDKHGACFLCIDELFELPVHKDRGGEIVAAIRVLQADNKMSEASADKIINHANENVGKTVTIAQVIPDEWLAASVDGIEMEEPI
jgi:hypothetical protein